MIDSYRVDLAHFFFTIPWFVAPSSNTGNQVQLGTSVIIGSVVGGAVVVLILALIIILIAVIVITAKQRSQSHQKLPAGNSKYVIACH